MPLTRDIWRTWRKIVVLAASFAFSIILLWYNYRGVGQFQHPGLLTASILLLLIILFATGIIELPAGMGIGPLGGWLRLADFVKAVVSFALIFVWTPIGMALTPDTPVGVTLLLAPDAVFLLAALVYLSNSFSGSAK